MACRKAGPMTESSVLTCERGFRLHTFLSNTMRPCILKDMWVYNVKILMVVSNYMLLKNVM